MANNKNLDFQQASAYFQQESADFQQYYCWVVFVSCWVLAGIVGVLAGIVGFIVGHLGAAPCGFVAQPPLLRKHSRRPPKLRGKALLRQERDE